MRKPSFESQKIEELWLGQSHELLKELHILTRDGKLNQDSRRKLKQVYHLTQLIQPYIEKLYEKNPNPQLVDVGCGKSYLGFMLYDLILRTHEAGEMIGIEVRKDLQEKSQKLAEKSGFQRMKFITADMHEWARNSVDSIAEGSHTLKPDFVCALHACDTATDDALIYAIQNNVQSIAVVPCCQAEVARLLDSVKVDTDFLWDYPIHRREFGSSLTNVLRTLVLKALGYHVTVTELVGWEHSLKNEIILCEKADHTGPQIKNSKLKLQKLLELFPIRPYLIQSLEKNLTL